MAQEVERKFLVCGDFKTHAFARTHITQAYISSVPERSVRVRINGNKSVLTIKGIGNESGTTRYEWEKSITESEAKELLKICEPGIIEKQRWYVKAGEHTFEIDEFFGENNGLVLAEIELNSEEEVFEKPDWLGKEVTGEDKYYNIMLMKNPYKLWQNCCRT